MPRLLFATDQFQYAFSRLTGALYPLSAGPSGAKWLPYMSVLGRMQNALAKGLETWRTSAGFFGVMIDGSRAHGGKLMGPSLKGAILEELYRFRPTLPGLLEWEGPVVKAIVNPLSDAWSEFERSFSVPHLHWYPGFASCPPPVALPTANKPCLLKSLAHSTLSLDPNRLTQRMKQSFAPPAAQFPAASSAHSAPAHVQLDPRSRAQIMASGQVVQSTSRTLAPQQQMSDMPPVPVIPYTPPNPYQYAPQLFQTVAYGLANSVTQWLLWQQVTRAMGTGPVPAANTGVRNGSVMPGNHLRS